VFALEWQSFLMLAKSPAFLYPGKGGLLYKSIIDDQKSMSLKDEPASVPQSLCA